VDDKGKERIANRLASHPFAFTTISNDDSKFGALLQDAIVRGEDELFPWGIGAKLKPGAIVALYVGNNQSLRVEERQRIRHLYSVAGASSTPRPKPHWKYLVYLYRRLTLPRPLLRDELVSDPILGGYAKSSFRSAGRATIPAQPEAVRAFWELVLARNWEVSERIQSRLLPSNGTSYRDDVAISYASEDMGFAQRLHDELAKQGRRSFYSTTAWALDDSHKPLLSNLLSDIFASAQVCVPLISKHYVTKNWPLLELAAMLRHPMRVLAACLDEKQLGNIDVRQVDLESINRQTAAEMDALLKKTDAVEQIDYKTLADVERVAASVVGRL